MANNLQIRWNKQVIEVPLQAEITVYDVRKFIEDRTEVPVERQKFSPAVLSLAHSAQKVLEITHFLRAKGPIVKLPMIGSAPKKLEAPRPASPIPAQPMEKAKKATKEQPASKETASAPAVVEKPVKEEVVVRIPSSAHQAFTAGINNVSYLISGVQSEVDKTFTSKRKKPNAEMKKKFRLQWTEQLTQIQLKLDAITLPSVPDVTAEERDELRQARKDLVVRSEKLISLIGQYCGL